MTPKIPSLAVLGLAGACALLSPFPLRADDPAPPAPVPSATATALDTLEAQAPKEWKDPAAIAASHARVIALIDGNTLDTGADYRRAAMLLQFHLGEYRIVRTAYELMLTAAAKGDASAEQALWMSWDQLMNQIGRAHRFDFGSWAQKTPEFAEYEPAPACVQAVWRDPAAARTAVAGITDNPEIKAIVDADQADRRGNWNTLTQEERRAGADRDKARNARMREIIAAGEVRTASDFAWAALVMQHSARFTGFRLAHELAVASMLLGDRGTGQWLVAASYDRLLRSAGLDQRFGTQMGPEGPLRVDESGICDRQRLALRCPTLEQARMRRASGSHVTSKFTEEITRPGNRLHDAKAGVSATYPEGWTVIDASPSGNATFVRLAAPGAASADCTLTFYYRRLDQPQPSAAAAEAILRTQAAEKEADRRKRSPDYRNRPDSFVFHADHGLPRLSWTADYTQDGAKWSEHLVRILGQNSVGLLFIDAPADRIDSFKAAIDAMAVTVELP